MQRGRAFVKSVNDASMGRSFPSVKLDFESSASANSATPAQAIGSYEARVGAQVFATRSRGCKLRGGPKISRRMIASRKPDFDASKVAMSVLKSAPLATGDMGGA